MLLVIDNYDSFVHNIARLLRLLGAAVEVIRNDRLDCARIAAMAPAGIVISPGPCGPAEAGVSLQVIQQFYTQVPILGICLGHQCIGAAFGAQVGRAREPMHGRASHVHHDASGVFSGLPQEISVGRYHALIVEEHTLGTDLRVTARSDYGEIMGLAHRMFPVWGVQFHPESVLTQYGVEMLRNFVQLCAGSRKDALS